MATDAAAASAAEAAGPAAKAASKASARSAVLTHALVLGGYLVVAVALTWHLWANPAGLAVAQNPWDADLFAWYMRYSATALAHGHLPALITASMNAPQGINMMWNTSILLPGMVLAPITLLAGPQVSLTVLMTLGFAGSAASLMLVLRRWRFGLWPAAVAGAIYGFSPALVQTAVGHSNLQFAVLPPLIVDAGLRLFVVPAGPGRVVRATVRQSAGAGVRLGFLAAAQLFIAEEWLALSALTTILVAVGLALARPVRAIEQLSEFVRADWRDARGVLAAPVAGAAMTAVVMFAVAGLALITQFAGPLTQHGSPFLVDYYKNDWTVFVTPSSYVLWHSNASALADAYLPGGAPEQLGYLGWPMIVLLLVCAVALWRDRRVRVLATVLVLFELLSLGAHPEVHGITHPHVTLPWHWIMSWPVLGLALPDRLSVFADGLVGVLIAVLLERAITAWRANGRRATSARRRQLVTWVAGAATVVAVVPLIPAPLAPAAVPAVPAGWSAAFADLHLQRGARVLVVPIPNGGLTNSMRWQATAGPDISLIGGYFMGPAWNGQAYIGGNGSRPTANYLDWLWLRTPSGRLAPTGPITPVPAPTRAVLLSDLAYWRPDAVVANASTQTQLGQYLISVFGSPTVTVGAIMAWRLNGAA